MITVKIVGAGGYGGVGITELLLQHPEVKSLTLVALHDAGKKMSDLYPHLNGFCDQVILAPDDPRAQEPVDVVFFATPDGVGMRGAAAELARGAQVIDYSGDFRCATAEAYADYAGRLGLETTHAAPDLLSLAVYGLAELHRGELTPKTRLVGNPGCFAVSCLLGLAPAVHEYLIDLSSIICDCKTGVSGAGKKPQPGFHYPARYEQMNAYRLSGHQHTCEVERELGALAGREIALTFTAQVVPICRGIMSCLYGTLAAGITAKDVIAAYREFYKSSQFVRIFDRQANVGTMQVRGTNYCNLVVDVDERTNRLRVVSYIDNLMKGQAGNALQCMNLLRGWPEAMGLSRAGQYP